MPMLHVTPPSVTAVAASQKPAQAATVTTGTRMTEETTTRKATHATGYARKE